MDGELAGTKNREKFRIDENLGSSRSGFDSEVCTALATFYCQLGKKHICAPKLEPGDSWHKRQG